MTNQSRASTVSVYKSAIKKATESFNSLSGDLTTFSSKLGKKTITRSSAVQQLTSLHEKANAMFECLKSDYKGSATKLRSAFRDFATKSASMAEALSGDDYPYSDFKRDLKSLSTDFLEAISGQLIEIAANVDSIVDDIPEDVSNLTDAQKELVQALRMTSNSADWKEVLQKMHETLREAKAAKSPYEEKKSTPATIDEATRKELEKASSTRDLLPLKLKQPFTLLRLPVIPVFADFRVTTEENIKKLAIPYIYVEGYAIFKDQVLLGVSKSECAKQGLSAFDYAESALAVINERGTDEFAFVSQTGVGNPRNSDIMFFWLLPSRKLNRILDKGSAKVSWSFVY